MDWRSRLSEVSPPCATHRANETGCRFITDSESSGSLVPQTALHLPPPPSLLVSASAVSELWGWLFPVVSAANHTEKLVTRRKLVLTVWAGLAAPASALQQPSACTAVAATHPLLCITQQSPCASASRFPSHRTLTAGLGPALIPYDPLLT